MSREIVRRLTSNRTHVADVTGSTAAVLFGTTYQRPVADVRALCGVLCRAIETVVMRTGTKVKCDACRHLAGGEVHGEIGESYPNPEVTR